MSRPVWEMLVCVVHLCLKGLSHIWHFWGAHLMIVRPVSLQYNLMDLQFVLWADQQVTRRGCHRSKLKHEHPPARQYLPAYVHLLLSERGVSTWYFLWHIRRQILAKGQLQAPAWLSSMFMLPCVSACILQRPDICWEWGGRAGTEEFTVIYYKVDGESRKRAQDNWLSGLCLSH